MKRYLVLGLECSTTKIVSKIIAENLQINNASTFDGHDQISNNNYLVKHLSMPYGQNRPKNDRFNFPVVKSEDWDHIIICIRDFWCSLQSKQKSHQPNPDLALLEHNHGKKILQNIAKYNNTTIFSYESWYILEETYLKKFLKNLDIPLLIQIQPKNINQVYLK